MSVNFYQNKRFFLCGITLIASVVGGSVIDHGIGGDNPSQMVQLASCWSKRRQSVITQSHNHGEFLCRITHHLIGSIIEKFTGISANIRGPR